MSLLTLLFRSFLTLGCTAAPEKPTCDEPIEVTVLSILATSKNNNIDPKLVEVAEEVQKKHKELTGFSYTLEKVRIAKGKSQTVGLVDKVTMEITVNEKPDEDGRVTLTIKPPKLAEIKYACRCGRYFPIITDYRTAADERLIIAVMAKPCMQKKKD